MRAIHFLLICCVCFCFSCNEKQKTQNEGIAGLLPFQSEFPILIDSGGIKIEKNHLFLDNQGNPYYCIDSLILPVFSDKSNDFLLFPFSIVPEQIHCFADGSIFFLQDTCLNKIADNRIEYSLPFPYRQINISKAGENGIYLQGYNPITNMYDLFFIDKTAENITKLLSDTVAVGAIIGTGNVSIVALDSTLYWIKDKEIYAFFKSEGKITSMADTEIGIFYATDKNAGFIDDNMQTFVFFNQGISKLLANKDTLFLLDNIGRFSMIAPIHNFITLTDSLTH